MGKFNMVYTTKRWKHVKTQTLIRDEYLCQWCKEKGIKKAAKEVHHIIHLTKKNYKDEKIAYNLKNLVSLCELCHRQHHNPGSFSTLSEVPFPIGVDSDELNRELS